MTVKEMQAGTVTYGIACSGVPPAATAKAAVAFSDTGTSGSGSGSSGSGSSSGTSSSGGGGGALQPGFLGLLALLVPLSRKRRTEAGRHRVPATSIDSDPQPRHYETQAPRKYSGFEALDAI